MNRIAALLFILLFFQACKSTVKDDNTRVITVSIEPIKFFVSAIAGSDYKVNVIVPPGASPATYEPPPAVIRDISNSDLMIINGYLGFELAWIDRLLNINDKARVLRLSDSQELIYSDSHRHGDIIHYTGVDPHFWMSPVRARIIARDIKDFLVASDPGNEELFLSNYNELDSIIISLDDYISSLFETADKKAFMIYHPSLTYFAQDYGLIQVPVEAEGKEPSPSELKRLIDEGREKNIDVIFVQREFDRKNANIIGKEIGSETIIIEPLSGSWVESLRNIAESIAGK